MSVLGAMVISAFLRLSPSLANAEERAPESGPWDLTAVTPNAPFFVNHPFVSITQLLSGGGIKYDGKIIENWGLLQFHETSGLPFISRPYDDSVKHQFATGICLQTTRPDNNTILARLTGLTIAVAGFYRHASRDAPKECRNGMIKVLSVAISMED